MNVFDVESISSIGSWGTSFNNTGNSLKIFSRALQTCERGPCTLLSTLCSLEWIPELAFHQLLCIISGLPTNLFSIHGLPTNLFFYTWTQTCLIQNHTMHLKAVYGRMQMRGPHLAVSLVAPCNICYGGVICLLKVAFYVQPTC